MSVCMVPFSTDDLTTSIQRSCERLRRRRHDPMRYLFSKTSQFKCSRSRLNDLHFFLSRFELNHQLGNLTKPYVAIMDGITSEHLFFSRIPNLIY